MAKKKGTKNFADVLRRKLAQDPDMAALVEAEAFNADIAIEIFNARSEADLTQKELADLVGTNQSVIARLESADYDGHSLTMLRRIATAVKKRLRVEFYCPLNYQDAVSTTKEVHWQDEVKWNPTVFVGSPSPRKHAVKAS